MFRVHSMVLKNILPCYLLIFLQFHLVHVYFNWCTIYFCKRRKKGIRFNFFPNGCYFSQNRLVKNPFLSPIPPIWNVTVYSMPNSFVYLDLLLNPLSCFSGLFLIWRWQKQSMGSTLRHHKEKEIAFKEPRGSVHMNWN